MNRHVHLLVDWLHEFLRPEERSARGTCLFRFLQRSSSCPIPRIVHGTGRRLMNEQPNLWDLLDSHFQNPPITAIEAGDIPQPYRNLLVHAESMTLSLEAAYQEEIRLEVWRQQFADPILLRQVLLVRQSDGKAVEMALIRIHLEHFSAQARTRVLEGDRPLGKLLRELGVKYSNRPSGFFQVGSGGKIGEALGLSSNPIKLYGRSNRLIKAPDEVLADVIEILAPFDPGSEGAQPGGPGTQP